LTLETRLTAAASADTNHLGDGSGHWRDCVVHV
jgi:hypothetical protein